MTYKIMTYKIWRRAIKSRRGMARIPLAIAAAIASAALPFTIGCGGSGVAAPVTGSTSGAGTGTVAVYLTTVPSTKVAAATVNIESAALTSGSSSSAVLSSSAGTYELNHLALAPTLLADSYAANGAYQGLSFTFANPQLQLVDNLGNVTLLTSSTTPSVQLAPGAVTLPDAITVASSTGSAFTVTLDLGKSLTVNTQGNYTFAPVLSVANATSTGPQMTGVPAQITSLRSLGSTGVQFTESGLALGVDLDAGPTFTGAITSASGLTIGQMVNIDAALAGSGTMVATLVDSQPAAATLQQRGVVTGVGNDSSGNLVVYTMPQ